ncbi:MAG: hypothetical protein C5B59_11430 [Bacteroidetes bacterium]|nr:MAG: hypothetical protein C5B59_11430 [Bacteroidota bacterium]
MREDREATVFRWMPVSANNCQLTTQKSKSTTTKKAAIKGGFNSLNRVVRVHCVVRLQAVFFQVRFLNGSRFFNDTGFGFQRIGFSSSKV